MMMIARRCLLLAAGAAAAFPYLAITQAPATPKRGGVLRIGTLGLDTSDFHRRTGSIGVPQAIVGAPTPIGDDGGVKPFLAEGWTISPDGKKKIAWRPYSFFLMNLRADNLRFS